MKPRTPATTQPDDLALYDVRQVGLELGIPERSARKLFDCRAFPLVHVGRRLYVRRIDLIAYLDHNTEEAQR